MQELNTPLLDSIKSPKDLRKLPVDELKFVCQELREYIINSVSKTSGHLASGLAVVELTTALHYVFNTPDDKIIFDVGHQAYPHKVLTGHKEELQTIRKKGGLHAFVWRGETEYDLLSTGHASTSIGSALGLAVCERNLKTKNKVVAVIGDGALSGGAAYEALNCAGGTKDLDLIVILNDNEMSISENVGSVSQYLASILASPYYVKFVEGGKKVLEKLPAIKSLAEKAQEHAKGMLLPGTLFEELGFNYIGPIDGHDLPSLVSILNNVKQIGGLQFVHVVTKKGKGYTPAEQNPTKYHGVPTFDPAVGISDDEKVDSIKTYSDVFGKWLCDMGKADEKLVAITPAMPVGSGMCEFEKAYPDRFFDVGIAEQHSMIFASGLAAGGLHPVVGIYSSFLQRAYDGLIHDMAIQDLPIVVAVDRAGIVGPDGPTHQGIFDIAFSRCIPNLTIMCPSDSKEQYLLLNTAYKLNKPALIRYSRDGDDVALNELSLDDTVQIGKAKTVMTGSKVAILCFGSLLSSVKDVCKRNDTTLIDMRFIKPLDEECIKSVVMNHDTVITLEEGVVMGGIGQEVMSVAHSIRNDVKVINLGISDQFVMEGKRSELLEDEKLDAKSIENLIKMYKE